MGRGTQSTSKQANQSNLDMSDVFTKPGLHDMQKNAQRMPLKSQGP